MTPGRTLAGILLPCMLFALPLSVHAQQNAASGLSSLAGRWAGAVQFQGQVMPVTMSFGDDDSVTGNIVFSEEGRREQLRVISDSSGFRVESRTPQNRLVWSMNCRVDGDRISGAGGMVNSSVRVEMQLVRLHSLNKHELLSLEGTYVLDDGEEIWVRVEESAGNRELVASFSNSGLSRVLFPFSKDEFLAGPEYRIPLPEIGRIRFDRTAENPIPNSLSLKIPGEKDRVATKEPDLEAASFDSGYPVIEMTGESIRYHDVDIASGEVKLKGRLYIPGPVESGPYPAVVQVHGSGVGLRTAGWHFYRSIFLRLGFAVLSYDKRGCGDSGGSFLNFTVEGSEELVTTLAQDAAAAHKWLANQPGIDRGRVGFVGGSQAGWIMPPAASITDKTSFVIVGCGPAVSADEESRFSELAKRMSLSRAEQRLENFKERRGYDPRAVLRQTETPTLWLFGDRDLSVPTRMSVKVLQEIARKGNPHHAIHVFSNCDHNFRNPIDGEGVLLDPVVATWLRGQGIIE